MIQKEYKAIFWKIKIQLLMTGKGILTEIGPPCLVKKILKKFNFSGNYLGERVTFLADSIRRIHLKIIRIRTNRIAASCRSDPESSQEEAKAFLDVM